MASLGEPVRLERGNVNWLTGFIVLKRDGLAYIHSIAWLKQMVFFMFYLDNVSFKVCFGPQVLNGRVFMSSSYINYCLSVVFGLLF